MNTHLKSAALTALALVGPAALAQVIYSPHAALGDQKIRVAPWGSGTIAESDEMPYEGTTSIRVSSRNFFQGGIMSFDNPVSLDQAAMDKSNMLVVTLQSSGSTTVRASTTGGGPAAGGAGAGGAGGAAGEGSSGRGGNNAGNAARTTTVDATLTKVRCVITTTDGKKSEVYIDLSSALANAKGWRSVGVPLVAIPGFDKSNRTIKSIAFSGDTVGTFYIGELKVVNDTTPLYVEPSVRELNLALGDEVTLDAYGNGGSSQLKYTWDFDDKNGVDVDAEGKSVKRRFRKDGTYTITLTVHDVFGLKKPYSTTIKVVVNP